ncbi:helix-turn-helix domain-containing protein [Solitalea canadensis]|uniref:DNA-binding protein, excisionase family n=1 Tax=Solitalea canadensis (strain ATCC 29591 / DSM 3403 / JCM 21819 / LMG 8368 / NBRC 15130 / NCIMB 12057 / USAM 9D) TaxID=929556 RepID=H8KU83_SOLCM|nr:helix-turn-helix domain-containing protein [Solitalea canadensis]AFD07195.1 DNA-binding protein, excisionase family [Solitalea canadensis DSM 3403]
METVLERTSKADQEIAKKSISKIRRINSLKTSITDTGFIQFTFQGSDEPLSIPKKAMALLNVILDNMAQGKSITLLPSDSEISTQEAADILNISRPYLVKLIEDGAIPFKKVGTHRRLNLNDVIEYDLRMKKIRDKKLEELAKLAQEMNLGY